MKILRPPTISLDQPCSQSGQGLIELIIAMAIFGLIAAGLSTMSVSGFRGIDRAGEETQAYFLVQQAMEAVRSIKDRAWNELEYQQSGITNDGSSWSFIGEGSTDNHQQYTRTITFADVCRDSSHDLVDCPGTYTDINSKQINISVEWPTSLGSTNFLSSTTYLTNWAYSEWVQTDWAGGAGQHIWSDPTKFDSSINVNGNTPGQLKLAKTAGSSGGTWTLAGGTEITDSSDIDFNQGVFSNSVVTGTGVDASILLDQSAMWAEHQDSRVATGQTLRDLSGVSATDVWAVGNNGVIIHYDGVSWTEFTDLGGQNIFGIDMLSSNDGWAVGARGKIWHYDGDSWSEAEDIGGQTLRGVYMVSSTDGWVVGNGGKIFRYDGVGWIEHTDTGGDTWEAVYMNTSADGWVVGRNGALRQFNGSSWDQVSSPTSNHLYGLHFTSSLNGWAVGRNGTILHYNGSNWTISSSPTNSDLNSVYFTAADDGWAVGDGGVILNYDGISWASVTSPLGNPLRSVLITGSGSGWIVGNGGRILQYDIFYDLTGAFESRVIDSGAADSTWNLINWLEYLPAGSEITLATRTGETAAPDSSWSSWSSELDNELGSDITSPNGRYLQYRATFTRGDLPSESPRLDEVTVIFNSPDINANLNGLSAVAETDIWAVGDNGTILHYDGSDWSPVSASWSDDINGINMVGPADGWAVGDSGKIWHYDGNNWSEHSDMGNRDLWSIHMLTSTDGWAVGRNGEIYQYNGSAWSLHTDVGGANLRGVFILDLSNSWVSADNGEIYYYDGSAWSLQADVGGVNLFGIFINSATDGWAVGQGGEIYRYNGTGWQLDADSGGNAWRAVYSANGETWTVGNGGNIYYHDGGNWTADASPTNQRLNDLAMISNQVGWAVGSNGTIIKLSKEITIEPLGNLISSALNMNSPSAVTTIEWDQDITACQPDCSVRFQLRSAPDAAGTPGSWSSWYGETGPGDYFTVNTGSLVPSALNGNQWIQYQAFLETINSETPILEEVRIFYK